MILPSAIHCLPEWYPFQDGCLLIDNTQRTYEEHEKFATEELNAELVFFNDVELARSELPKLVELSKPNCSTLDADLILIFQLCKSTFPYKIITNLSTLLKFCIVQNTKCTICKTAT